MGFQPRLARASARWGTEASEGRGSAPRSAGGPSCQRRDPCAAARSPRSPGAQSPSCPRPACSGLPAPRKRLPLPPAREGARVVFRCRPRWERGRVAGSGARDSPRCLPRAVMERRRDRRMGSWVEGRAAPRSASGHPGPRRSCHPSRPALTTSRTWASGSAPLRRRSGGSWTCPLQMQQKPASKPTLQLPRPPHIFYEPVLKPTRL